MKIKILKVMPRRLYFTVGKIELLIVIFTAFIFFDLPVLATTVIEPWYHPSQQRADPLYDEATLEKMKSIKTSVNWNNISLESAIEDLVSRSQKADPSHVGIKLVSQIVPNGQKISIVIEDASIENILGYLSQQAHLRIKIHKGQVVLLPLK